eukprot:TRINITY_DN869_c0_g2_i1.p1 TRINITY_DN869_c0_g2~~TRINITY_DN869_c0_g2_i1.p1  ORF type:complete len:146 (+),score=29.74 TRINITY_DN869_c0_g2_i1:238-675(+)
MGKESAQLLRIPPKPKSSHPYSNTKALQMEFSKQWASQKEVVFEHEVVENGYVIVYVQTPLDKIKLICPGMNKKGNSYKTLLAQLQSNGVISLITKAKSFQVQMDNLWETVDPEKDTFQANDSILIQTNDILKIKKRIVKAKKYY